MKYSNDEPLRRIAGLKVYARGDRRAPHKPLLVLVALGALSKGQKSFTFEEIEERLAPLLRSFAPPVKGKVQPELPYWYLVNDGIWRVEGGDQLPLTRARFPRMDALRKTSASFTKEVSSYFEKNPEAVTAAAEILLREHFPPSVHEDLLAAAGIEVVEPTELREIAPLAPGVRMRDPKFRSEVLRAYEYRCAASGFCAALGGSYFGCEAAHVRWHACDGPDSVENGMALEPTLHKLFDAGAWSLTDDRRIIVSSEFTGTDITTERIRSLHGNALRNPLPGFSAISVEHIRWHREQDEGGVFRGPPLPL